MKHAVVSAFLMFADQHWYLVSGDYRHHERRTHHRARNAGHRNRRQPARLHDGAQKHEKESGWRPPVTWTMTAMGNRPVPTAVTTAPRENRRPLYDWHPTAEALVGSTTRYAPLVAENTSPHRRHRGKPSQSQAPGHVPGGPIRDGLTGLEPMSSIGIIPWWSSDDDNHRRSP